MFVGHCVSNDDNKSVSLAQEGRGNILKGLNCLFWRCVINDDHCSDRAGILVGAQGYCWWYWWWL